MDTAGKTIEIITGRYGKGTPEQNKVVDFIFGKELAGERFEIYFHWYNILHELGHGIMNFNAEVRPHPVNEEQLVNDFAVAYWLHYGENEKLRALDEIVSYALAHTKCPAAAGITHIEYALQNWQNPDFFNFNDYGWFQFSCVVDSLHKRKNLEYILSQMGVKNIQAQAQVALVYSLEEESTAKSIINNAVDILREWKVTLPEVNVVFDNDPNRQMCHIVDL